MNPASKVGEFEIPANALSRQLSRWLIGLAGDSLREPNGASELRGRDFNCDSNRLKKNRIGAARLEASSREMEAADKVRERTAARAGAQAAPRREAAARQSNDKERAL